MHNVRRSKSATHRLPENLPNEHLGSTWAVTGALPKPYRGSYRSPTGAVTGALPKIYHP